MQQGFRAVLHYDSCVAQLQQCIKRRAISEGQCLHSKIMADPSLAGNTFLGNLLIKLYGGCGSVDESCSAYQGIHRRNVYSWNIMMNAFLTNLCLEEAQFLFNIMPRRDVVSWNGMITATTQQGNLLEVKELFDRLPERAVISWNSMIAAYAQLGESSDAVKMLGKMPEHSVVSWTATITAYAQNQSFDLAKELFHGMRERNDVSWSALVASSDSADEFMSVLDRMPQWNVSALTSLIQAHGQENRLEEAWMIFCTITDRNEFFWNIIIQSCTQNGDLRNAEIILGMMPSWDLITCNVMITAYGQNNRPDKAWWIFCGMPESSATSWNSMLAVSVNRQHQRNSFHVDCRKIFSLMPHHDAISVTAMLSGAGAEHFPEAELLFRKILSRNIFAWNAMLQAYAQANLLRKAAEFFEKMPGRDLVSWNTMISALAHSGSARDAIRLRSLMDLEGISSDEITIINLLEAISAAPHEGAMNLILEEIHFTGIPSVAVMNSLVNACAKCGFLNEAWSIFSSGNDHMTSSSSWSSIVSAYALNGLEKDALRMLQIMLLTGVTPNETVYVNLLSACSHGGDIKCGIDVLRLMSEDGDGVSLDCYLCFVDLLARAGRLEEAAEVLTRDLPFEPNVMAWTSFLAACGIHGDAERAALSAARICEMDPENGAGYVLLSNVGKSGLDELIIHD